MAKMGEFLAKAGLALDKFLLNGRMGLELKNFDPGSENGHPLFTVTAEGHQVICRTQRVGNNPHIHTPLNQTAEKIQRPAGQDQIRGTVSVRCVWPPPGILPMPGCLPHRPRAIPG